MKQGYNLNFLSSMPRSLLTGLFTPRLDWLQVEVTTHCNAACIYCPHTVYRESWESRHLTLETFRRLLPDLKRADLVYLQGWGEPFLHPEFFTMAALAREAGRQVGVTTNGMLLDARLMARLVDLEVAVVAFSLAGVGETNDRVRRGTRFAKVLENIHRLKRLKEQGSVSRPAIHLAYMLLRSGLPELTGLPEALAGSGVEQVVVSTLDFAATPGLARESLKCLTPEAQPFLAARLRDLMAQGRRQGLTFSHYLPPLGQHSRLCPENVGRAGVVGADGAVAPCVFLNLAVQGVRHVTGEGERPYQRMTFGFLDTQSFRGIWRSPAYRKWRRAFLRGPQPPSCRGCLKVC